MDWRILIAEMFDLRAFDSLWFWVLLGVCWALVTQRALGVPWDLVQRGRDSGDDGAAELDALVHLYAHRTLENISRGAVSLLAFGCFVLTILLVAGFFYGSEISQALFLLGAPLCLVVPLNAMTARAIVDRGLSGPDLWRALRLYRFQLHVLAAVSILIIAAWGMVLSTGVLA